MSTSHCRIGSENYSPSVSFLEPLKLPELVAFSLQMALGVRHLHAYALVHRDIALRNFLIVDVQKYEVVIADFGLTAVATKGKV